MKEIERVGIPVTQICAVVDIAKSVGSSDSSWICHYLSGGKPILKPNGREGFTAPLCGESAEHADKAGFQGGCGGRAVRQKRFSAYLP